MSASVIVCISPFHDTAVVVGPFRSDWQLRAADDRLTRQGWNTEICELVKVGDVEAPVNDEGAEE